MQCSGSVLWGLIPTRGHQEGFLEEGASSLSLEGRAGASLVEREEPVSGRGKGMCKARGCKEQGEFEGALQVRGEAGQARGPASAERCPTGPVPFTVPTEPITGEGLMARRTPDDLLTGFLDRVLRVRG